MADEEMPAETTPTAAVEKRKPCREVGMGRVAIADLRRVNLGFPISKYYPIRVHTAADIARLVLFSQS